MRRLAATISVNPRRHVAETATTARATPNVTGSRLSSLRSIADKPSWVSRNNRAGCYVPGHNRMSADDRPLPPSYIGADKGAGTDPGLVSDFYG